MAVCDLDADKLKDLLSWARVCLIVYHNGLAEDVTKRNDGSEKFPKRPCCDRVLQNQISQVYRLTRFELFIVDILHIPMNLTLHQGQTAAQVCD